MFHLCSKVKRCGDCNEDGCGCKQPTRIRMDSAHCAEWENKDDEENKMVVKLTELILRSSNVLVMMMFIYGILSC